MYIRRDYRGGVVRFHYSSIPLTVVTRRYTRVFARRGHCKHPPFNTTVFSYGNNGTKGARKQWNKEHSCRYSESKNFSFLVSFFFSFFLKFACMYENFADLNWRYYYRRRIFDSFNCFQDSEFHTNKFLYIVNSSFDADNF